MRCLDARSYREVAAESVDDSFSREDRARRLKRRETIVRIIYRNYDQRGSYDAPMTTNNIADSRTLEYRRRYWKRIADDHFPFIAFGITASQRSFCLSRRCRG